MTDTIATTDDATREQIARAIAELRRRHKRLPVHFEEQRKVLADEVDLLVLDYLATPE